ncbi:hypothetical protein MMC08_004610 [Hypocenomyce scalaris]|nr:hypothetical protein [Hypocenomyce scalaris]
MTGERLQDDSSPLPDASAEQVYVQVAALNGGYVTLPERLFITDADPDKAATVPSMCFLIQHPSPGDGKSGQPTRIVFDLGLKRDLSQYAEGMQRHISQRQPIHSLPDTAASLVAAGLDPASDIDIVILSHSHWDHIGTSSDYTNSKFVVGSGTLHIFKHGAPHYPAEMFEKDPLPLDRTLELPPTPDSKRKDIAAAQQTEHNWIPFGSFPNAVDFFSDGSMYIIDSPGHLQGHINLLLRVSAKKWVYLGGDCCHDPRILKGEKDVAEYDDGHGGKRSVHSDLPTAKETIKRIRKFLGINGDSVEWIVAHDLGWATKNQHRFFPNQM